MQPVASTGEVVVSPLAGRIVGGSRVRLARASQLLCVVRQDERCVRQAELCTTDVRLPADLRGPIVGRRGIGVAGLKLMDVGLIERLVANWFLVRSTKK